ncbi:MAG TPA: hypothetical protein VFR61_04450 [Nitrososphaeraceae archaeon]|nr:hypothetical protein [Nitrososphaeraceae archaeon]
MLITGIILLRRAPKPKVVPTTTATYIPKPKPKVVRKTKLAWTTMCPSCDAHFPSVKKVCPNCGWSSGKGK